MGFRRAPRRPPQTPSWFRADAPTASCSLVPNSTVNYMVDNFYTPAAEEGVRWNDPALAIRWPLTGVPTISAKDAAWPLFKDLKPVEF